MADTAVPGAAGETTLELAGPVTLNEVSHWRDALLSALGRGGRVTIDLAQAGPWDAAGLQLIIAAVKTGAARAQEVRLTRIPEVFLRVVDQAGAAGCLAEAMPSGTE